MDRGVLKAVMRNIGYLTQLGFSVAFPMVAFIMGAVWLMNRFELGGWVVILGVFLGMGTGISSFASFARHMMKETRRDRKDEP